MDICTNFNGEDLDILVTYFYGGCDAYTRGLPEDCYPAENPEVEIEVLTKGLEHWFDDSELKDHVIEVILSEQGEPDY